MSQEEIDKLRRQEIIIEDSDIAGSGDGMYLKQLRYRDTANTEIRTTNKSDFAEKYREDSFLYEKIERVTSSGSIYYRSPRSVERFALYGATRNNPYDEDATNVEVLVKTFRETVFGQSGKVQELGYGLNGPIDTRASEIQSSMMQSGVPETITANTTAFDTAGSDGIIQKQIDSDPTKTAVLSAFDGLESKEKVCSFVFGIDAMNFNIKLTKARALAKYGGHFLTMADANKVGAVTSHHVALINGIQAAKSEDTDSYKLAFDQSEGYLLVSQGLIETDRKLGGLTRSTSGGNPSLLYLNQLLGNLNFATPVEGATSDPFYTTSDLKKAYNS
ncbi:hypothetical protein EOM57_02335, partial [Candidatus Saccharibacteria bacterium]|nr:hypothetical protein [Candidatus Saccharibacteria bacterium]